MAKAAPEQPTEADLKRASYNAAEKRLKDENKARFDELVQEEAAARGVTYTRRLTESEKAEQKLTALLAAHPELREKIAGAG